MPRPAPKPTREVLEEALAADPDDVALHSAYADLLTEQNDPRGEFIRVQLALEDESLSRERRKELQQRERELWKANARTWLGELYPLLLGRRSAGSTGPVGSRYAFRRGWLDVVKAERFSVAFARALVGCPVARLLSRLEIEDVREEDEGDFEPGPGVEFYSTTPGLEVLESAEGWGGSVRFFRLGREDNWPTISGIDSDLLPGLVAKMPRLRELRLHVGLLETEKLFGLKTLTDLRALIVSDCQDAALTRLARNPALAKLEDLHIEPNGIYAGDPARITLSGLRALVNSPHLQNLKSLGLHFTDFGDAGVRAIVRSDILKRLKQLDLAFGCITDEGARLLADCPDLDNLQEIDLTGNALTAEGIALLEESGVLTLDDEQHDPDDRSYLHGGDYE